MIKTLFDKSTEQILILKKVLFFAWVGEKIQLNEKHETQEENRSQKTAGKKTQVPVLFGIN